MLSLAAVAVLLSQDPPSSPPSRARTPGPTLAMGQPAHQYFFESGSAELSPGALARVRETAEMVRREAWFPRTDAMHIHLVGQADRSGSEQFNQALSERRAAAVRDALIAEGVPSEIIHIAGTGEHGGDMALDDGVSEPMHRRVWFAYTQSREPYRPRTFTLPLRSGRGRSGR